jgi:hypothetical protein
MAHHHKSNQAVEGDPDSGHGRGLPRRPDEEELAERIVRDRLDAGLRGGLSPSPEAEYGQGQVEVDAEVEAGEIPTDTSRRARTPFPPPATAAEKPHFAPADRVS